jgi:hypothetical protein
VPRDAVAAGPNGEWDTVIPSVADGHGNILGVACAHESERPAFKRGIVHLTQFIELEMVSRHQLAVEQATKCREVVSVGR